MGKYSKVQLNNKSIKVAVKSFTRDGKSSQKLSVTQHIGKLMMEMETAEHVDDQSKIAIKTSKSKTKPKIISNYKVQNNFLGKTQCTSSCENAVLPPTISSFKRASHVLDENHNDQNTCLQKFTLSQMTVPRLLSQNNKENENQLANTLNVNNLICTPIDASVIQNFQAKNTQISSTKHSAQIDASNVFGHNFERNSSCNNDIYNTLTIENENYEESNTDINSSSVSDDLHSEMENDEEVPLLHFENDEQNGLLNQQCNGIINNNQLGIQLRNEQESHNEATCCSACRIQNVQIINKLNVIEAKLDALITEGSHPIHRNLQENFNLLPTFPVNDFNTLKTLDENLQLNEEMKQQFISKISSIGGDTMAKLSNNIMSLIITDELAKNLTWVALIRDKTRICEKFFTSLIVGVVRTTYKTATTTEIKKVLQKWVQKPSDRIANKMKKLRRQEMMQQ